VATVPNKKRGGLEGRPEDDRKILPLLMGAEAEALRQQCSCCALFFRKSPNEPLGNPDLRMISLGVGESGAGRSVNLNAEL
jgi:hypothetical protein